MEFPINTQEEFDAAIKDRLTREKDKWEKSTNIDEYRQRAEQAESNSFARIRDRDAKEVLRSMNVPKERHGRILKLADLPTAPGEDGEPDRKALVEAFKSLHGDMAEVFGSEATVEDTALDTSTGDQDHDAPLTVERVEAMSADEINEPSMWDRVQRFMAGERA
ncbi:hypothetical protein BH24ACT22_BH24ACT22_13610 [soil metagenome]